MSFRCGTPDERLAFDTEAEANAKEAQIRGGKVKPVVVWRDGYEEEIA